MRRAARFAVVGTSNTLVDFAVFNALVLLTGIPAVPSGAISYGVGLLNSFAWNRAWTFRDGMRRGLVAEFAYFGVLNSVGLAINSATLWVLLSAWPSANAPGEARDVVILNAAKAVALIASMTWNFLTIRRWVWPAASA